MTTNPGSRWYQDAVIYQVHVRAFYDSDGDGIGDFRGLMQKLGYLEGLGVTALWLLPFYPSPLRDDGYDISNYTDVHPSYGTLRDFQMFLEEAHRCGLRVITELVLNHTSDQHPWFQRARRAPAGSPERDFYVWSDTPDRYQDARIIFQDFEQSNWSWDPVANAYFWHRFFHHQPDLNWANPAVREAMFAVLDFWLERGVDGVRLDAVPYLFEREGTTCENLPETHEVLKQLRRHVDERYSDRMLLAEANQWPEDAVAYFGQGDECHMAFHFPLMPRMFMAVQREDRFPVIDILQQTPAIPETCQWTTFLRNHDELTLEMVTDEERDYMYRVYAEDPQARVNLGIRRRLAPLVKNDRRVIELLNGLLFTLLGTPIVYYGDELGMGDNIYLGDRDSVRTPMQWSADRNAGFSQANPQKLYLPVIVDPEFHYAAINVETQQDNRNSLLWWMRRLINMRKDVPALGHGSLEFLLPDNPKVLAFLRELEGETVLVIANLSRFAQYVELDLSRFEGSVPVELFGKTAFPPIGALPYLLTLSPYAFQLFVLTPNPSAPLSISERSLPTERIRGDWRVLLSGSGRRRLEAAFPSFLKHQAWFLGRNDIIRGMTIESVFPVDQGGEPASWFLVIVIVEYVDRETERYALPLGWAQGDRMTELVDHHPERVLLRLIVDGVEQAGVIFDASQEPEYHEWWRHRIQTRTGCSGGDGEIVFHAADDIPEELGVEGQPVSLQPGHTSHAWLRFGDAVVLRLFQHVDAETSPALEMDRMLSRHSPPGLVPQWLGAWEARRSGSRSAPTLALLYRSVSHQGTARRLALDHLQQFWERVETNPAFQTEAAPSSSVAEATMFAVREASPSDAVRELMGPWLDYASRIGERTAELHNVLSAIDDPEFLVQKCTPHYQRSLYQSMRTRATRTWTRLRRLERRLDLFSRPFVERLMDALPDVLRGYERVLQVSMTIRRMRCHGDYGLEKLLFTGKDFVIYDFQGDVRRSVGERRLKRPGLSDLAALLWSVHRTARSSLQTLLRRGTEQTAPDQSEPWTERWIQWTSAAILGGYRSAARAEGLVPHSDAEFQTLLSAYLMHLAVDELEGCLQEQGNIPSELIGALLRLIHSGN